MDMLWKKPGALMEADSICIFSSDLPVWASRLFMNTKPWKANELCYSNSVTSVKGKDDVNKLFGNTIRM